MLPNLVHPDQTGFVKGRYIGENIRLINNYSTRARWISNVINNYPAKSRGISPDT